jgi:hypothetical protein
MCCAVLRCAVGQASTRVGHLSGSSTPGLSRLSWLSAKQVFFTSSRVCRQQVEGRLELWLQFAVLGGTA